MRATVLVGYDDKAPAQRALERAIAEATAARGGLVVVSVFELPLDPEAPRYFGTLDDGPAAQVSPELPPELEPVLAHAHQRIAEAGIAADLLWAAGEPAGVIVEAARERKATLVVLGAHHHGFLSRAFGTDVAAEVERKLGAGVIVVE